jgi:hypothetical protein
MLISECKYALIQNTLPRKKLQIKNQRQKILILIWILFKTKNLSLGVEILYSFFYTKTDFCKNGLEIENAFS